MSETAVRRLTAIVAADVFGYSRLIAADEEATLAHLRGHRSQLIDPLVAKHGGRIANTAGDSLLIEFPSVVEALRFAVAMQKGIEARNSDVPEPKQLIFRVGINLGDVVEQDGDLLGDGVNVAARIEALAKPGSINISAAARDQIGGKVNVGFKDLGEQLLKNIPQPVRIFQVLADGETAHTAGTMFGKPKPALVIVMALGLAIVAGGLWWSQPWSGGSSPKSEQTQPAHKDSKPESLPTIAVLPFNNMSDDKDQDYFSDGIAGDLITDLSKVSGLLVIARNSTFAYKGQSPDVREVGQELNARYVVEGSVRKAGGRVRINAQLIDAKTGNHLWAERYDRQLEDVFSLQDEVTEKIVAALKVTLRPDEKRRLAHNVTDDPQAYDIYLRGLREEGFFTKEGNLNSQNLFLQAVDRDPSFAAAYAHLAQAYSLMVENNWTKTPGRIGKLAVDMALKGVELDGELPFAHWSLGRVFTRPFVARYEEAKAAFQKATALNPSYADGFMFLAMMNIFTGKAPEALPQIERAMRLNPRLPFWYLQGLGMAQFFMGNLDASVQSLTKAVERNPNVPWVRQYLVAAYGQQGSTDDAQWEVSEIETLGQTGSIKAFLQSTPIQDPVYRKIYRDALRKAGVPEG